MIEPSLVTPKPKPAYIDALAKAQAGEYADKFGSGIGGTPSAQCSPGASGAAPSDPSNVAGPTSNAPGSLSGPTGGVNSNVLDMVRNSIPAGCFAQVTPNGGKAPRPERPGSAHPLGLATDTMLFCGGQQQFAGSPQMNQYIRNLNANGARGLSYYDDGFVHADLMGQDQRHWGPNQDYVRALRRGEDPGPGTANAAQGSGPGGGGGPCQGGGGSSCQPISSSAPQIASGLAQNKGFNIPSVVSGLASALTGGSPLAAAMAGVQSAVQGALSAAGPLAGIIGAIPLSPAALADPTSAITQAVANQVAGMGASILPSIVGNVPAQLINQTGIVQGLISDKITDTAKQVFAVNSPPQLDRFISIFNAANGAQGFASSLQLTFRSTVNNVFGNAGKLFEDYSANNWANVPGIPNQSNPYLKLDGPDIGEVKSAVDLTITRDKFIGPPGQILPYLVSNNLMNAFSSMFYDYDAYVTRGFGTITNNVIEFGMDLKDLGKLADLNDMLRIGTPGQIAQQIIINGGGIISGLTSFLMNNNLTLADLSDPQNDETVYAYMAGVTDTDVVDSVLDLLDINAKLKINSLDDLCKAKKILPRSHKYNYFENLNDIAVFLSICLGRMPISTLAELGAIIESFEVPFNSSKIQGDPATYDYRELSDFANEYAPIGLFTSDGSLSIADFIGSAAGYIHEKTIPRIAEIQSYLYTQTSYFTDYLTLLDTLKFTAAGLYTTPAVPPSPGPAAPGFITVPSFGVYTTLNDAITAIVAAIEAELTSTLAKIEADNDLEVLDKIRELDSLHTESSMYLAREHKLRKEYGIALGSPKKSDVFIGDDTTKVLPLTADIDTDQDFSVYVDGKLLAPGQYTINANNNTITLSQAPAIGEIATVKYNTDTFEGIANKMQVWEFASNIENYALETGYGRSADFLRRVVTNDEYGQRIVATMMLARNKARLASAGFDAPNFETNSGINPTYTSYVNQTGIWSSNPKRAASLYLELNQDVENVNEYLVDKISTNADIIRPDVEKLMRNVVRQLLFSKDGYIYASNRMLKLYENNPREGMFDENRLDLALRIRNNLSSDGRPLGAFDQIISYIITSEGMKNDELVVPLSGDTKNYLERLGIDLEYLVSLCQRIMIASVAANLGITEQETASIFGVQSLSKALLYNTANGL